MSGVPAAFLDRDGVLIEDCGYPHKPEHLALIPGAAAAVRRLKELGYLTVIVTNQSGVARGLFTEEQMHDFNGLLTRRLAQDGGVIDAVYAAPYHADANVVAVYQDGVITKEQIIAHYRMASREDQSLLRSVEGVAERRIRPCTS